MLLSMIAAASENNVIGKDNALPWSLPDDLARLRVITAGKPLIMGRKTHESIGRPLPGRLNIVVTRDPQRTYAGCTVVTSLAAALAAAEASGAAEAVIFGGAELYAQALPTAQRIYLTRVHTQLDGDAHFPPLPPGEWTEVSREEHAADAQHVHGFTFLVYERL